MPFIREVRDACGDVKAAVRRQPSQDGLRSYYAVRSKDKGMGFTSSNDKNWFPPRVEKYLIPEM